MSKRFAVLLALSIVMVGCASSYNSTVSSDQQSFVLIKGNLDDKTLFIDNGQIDLNKSKTFIINNIKAAKFPVANGNITIKILNADKILIHKNTYIFKGQTYEVIIP